MLGLASPPNNSDMVEPGVGGVPNRFLGVTPAYLWQVQQEQPAMAVVCIFGVYGFEVDV